MWIGLLPSLPASSIARSRRPKFFSEYQTRTSSSLSRLSRPARSVKKPRPWLDQAKLGICLDVSQAFHSSLEEVTQPAQIGSSISASEKLLESAPGFCLPFFSA